MNLLWVLLRASWGTIVLVAAAGLLSGACNAGLIALINHVLHQVEAVSTGLMRGFVGLGLAKLLSSALSRILLTRLAQQVIAGLRRDLSRQILAAPLRQVEEIGIPRLLVALTDDVQVIRDALLNIPALVVNIAILIGCSVYLGWLSWTTLLAIGGLVMLGVCSSRWQVGRAWRFLKLARQEQDTLFRHFHALTAGIKELTLHRQRRQAFLSQALDPTIETLRHHNVDAMTRLTIVHSWNQFFFYALIGLLLFALPALQELGAQSLTGYILTIVYLLGPLEAVIQVLPAFGRANAALQKVEELGLSLAARSANGEVDEPHLPALAWESLELVGIVYAYAHEMDHRHFTLGPIDLTLHPGELVFLAGGNGSGKSTLAKLLTGLYTPQAGEIRLHGRPLTDANREWYRQHFSAVFSDFYLFETLLGLPTSRLDARARDYLVRLQLDREVQVEAGAFSTTALSQGQRKRLALLTAYLEDRPIYIFDEWAADQDLTVKEIFYTQLLPELKTRGKAVLVISHDERYFHLADRVLKLEEGKLVQTGRSPLPV